MIKDDQSLCPQDPVRPVSSDTPSERAGIGICFVALISSESRSLWDWDYVTKEIVFKAI